MSTRLTIAVRSSISAEIDCGYGNPSYLSALDHHRCSPRSHTPPALCSSPRPRRPVNVRFILTARPTNTFTVCATLSLRERVVATTSLLENACAVNLEVADPIARSFLTEADHRSCSGRRSACPSRPHIDDRAPRRAPDVLSRSSAYLSSRRCATRRILGLQLTAQTPIRALPPRPRPRRSPASARSRGRSTPLFCPLHDGRPRPCQVALLW
jgi:hypothetical protein